MIHEQGIVHADLKPSNLLMTGRDYDLKLTDFGVSTRHISLIVKFDQLPPACMRPLPEFNSHFALLDATHRICLFSPFSVADQSEPVTRV